MIILIMGVCGVGKTAVGQALAQEFGTVFRDADEFHSTENRDKMSNSIPLTDEDRFPWLQSINKYILQMLHNGTSALLTCSALKKIYRNILLQDCPHTQTDGIMVKIIYLKGSEEVIQQRLNERTGHFMSPALLKSQLETLEEPDSDEKYCVTIDTDGKSLSDIVVEIKNKIS